MNNKQYAPIFEVKGSKGSVKIYAWFVDVAVLEAVTHFDIGIESGVTAKCIKGEPLSDYNRSYNNELKAIRN